MQGKQIKDMTDAEKAKTIEKICGVFDAILRLIDTLRTDVKSTVPIEQASALWISGQFCRWFDDFMGQIKNLEKQKAALQEQIEQAATEGVK